MGFYIGNSEKLKVTLSGAKCGIQIIDKVKESAMLFSADNYILKDSQGLYLVPKESE